MSEYSIVREKKCPMNAKNLIVDIIPALSPQDSGEKALAWMADFHLRHLPVVEQGELIGIISEDHIWDFNDPAEAIGSYLYNNHLTSVQEKQHFFDVLKAFVDANLSILPVLNEQQQYSGIITAESLLKYFSEMGFSAHPGGVLVIEMDYRDYSLAEISRLIEGEKTAVLCAFVSSPHGTTKLELTLKTNKPDLQHVIATLERFNYTIKAHFNDGNLMDIVEERYQNLMHYLNV